MTMRLAQPGAVQVRVDRAVGSRGRQHVPARRTRSATSATAASRRSGASRSVRAQAAAVPRQVMLDLRLRPGLYRLTVRVQLEDGRLSPPARRFLRVVG